MMLFKNVLKLTFLFSLLFPVFSYATCFWSGVGEAFVPGLGYAINGQWDKTIIVGGLRYWVRSERNYYWDNIEDATSDIIFIDREDSESGKYEKYYYYDKETWKYSFYGSEYLKLAMMSIWDLYQNCEPNNELYKMSLAPLNFPHFYDKWYFWAPLIFTYALHEYIVNEQTDYHFYLGNGLKESEYRRDRVIGGYTAGLSEEMLFRGVLQDYFYKVMKDDWKWSAGASRHVAVWIAAILFGASHTSSESASQTQAALIGAYLGYVYQPTVNDFDLTTAIAIHSWWDVISRLVILNSAYFEESDEPVEIPVFSVSFRF